MKEKKFDGQKMKICKVNESVWLAGILLAFLSIVIGFLYWTGNVGKISATKQYKSDIAYQALQRITQNERPIGTSGNQKGRDVILQMLKAEDIRVAEITSFAMNPDFAPPLDSGEVHNLLAEIKGETEDAVLVVAHYDSVPCSKGAGDNAIAVSNLIQIASELNQEGHSKNTILFLFTDGEEIALLGAKGFLKENFSQYQIKSVINLEGRGNSGIPLMFQCTSGSGKLVKKYTDRLPFAVCSSIFADIYQYLTFNSDFTVFKDSVSLGLNFAFIEGLGAYHGVQDTSENLDSGTAYMQYLSIKKSLNILKDADLQQSVSKMDKDLYWTICPGKVLFYPKWLNYIVLVITTMAMVWLKRKNGWTDVSGWLRALLHVVAMLLLGVIYIQALKIFNPYLYKSWRLQPLGSRFILIGNAIIAFVVTVLFYKLCKSRNNRGSWEFEMTAVILLIEILCAVFVPALVLPVFTIGLPAMVIGMMRKQGKIKRTFVYIALLWLPLVVNSYTISLFYCTLPAYLGAVFMVLPGVWLIHLFDVAEIDKSHIALKWMPIAGVICLSGIMIYQLGFADFSNVEKRPSSLYVYQDLDGKDYFFTEQNELDSWQQDILGKNYIKHQDKMFFGMTENYKLSKIEGAHKIEADTKVDCSYAQGKYSLKIKNKDFDAIYFLIENGNAVKTLKLNGEGIRKRDKKKIIQEGSMLIRVFNTEDISLDIWTNENDMLKSIKILGMNYGLSYETPALPDVLQEAWPGYMTHVGLTELILDKPAIIKYERKPVIEDAAAKR